MPINIKKGKWVIGNPTQAGTGSPYPPDTTYTNINPLALTEPAYLGTVIDTSYTTHQISIQKITDDGQDLHQYSKTATYNCDMTRMFLGDNYLNVNTFAVIGTLGTGSGNGTNPQWSSFDPNKIITTDNVNKIKVIDPRLTGTASVTVVKDFGASYTKLALGPSEGNISDNDAVMAFDSVISGEPYFTVYNLETNTTLANVAQASVIGTAELDWISTSPSGQHIIIRLRSPHPTAGWSLGQFTPAMVFVRALTNGSHPSFNYDQNNNEIIQTVIPIQYINLNTGISTNLDSLFLTTTYNGTNGGHTSRAKSRRGWCYISLTSGKRENLAVKLDTSGTCERFGFSRDLGTEYIDEGKGVVSTDGRSIIVTSRFNRTTGNAHDYQFKKVGTYIPEPLGFGYAFLSTVTGGEGGTSVQVSTAAQYIAAIQTVGPVMVEVTADITFNGVTGSGTLKTLQGNKTIWSANGKKVKGIGHWLTGATGGNIICRNIVFAGSGYDTDTFRIGGAVEGVFFDHCTFTGETEYWEPAPVEGSQADNDGVLDGGNDWKNVTFGNCKFDTWDKLMLLQNQFGPKRATLTWYNCYVTNVKQRVPSVFSCDLHIFNTVFENSRGGAQITLHEDSNLLLEQCYIDDYTKTIHCWADFTGTIDPRSETDNILVNSSVLYDPSMAGVKNLATFEPIYRAEAVAKGVIKPMSSGLANYIKATAGATLSL